MNDPWGAPQASASLNTNDQMFANSMSNNDPWATSTVAQPVAATAPNSDPFASWDAPAPAATTPSTMPTSSSFDLLGGDVRSIFSHSVDSVYLFISAALPN